MNVRFSTRLAAATAAAIAVVALPAGIVSASPAGHLPVFKGFTPWSAPVNIGAPVNTQQFEENAPAISSDGRSLYFNRNPAGLIPPEEDLYASHRANPNKPWGEPVALDSLNTAFNERNTSLSRDDQLLFFSSDRQPGGVGGLDLYVSHRADPKGRVSADTWAAPTNLGPLINSTANDVGPAYFEDADGTAVLYFTSNRGGNFDIYVSRLGADGSPGMPLAVTELNSPGNDARPAIRADGLELVFQSNRMPSTGMADLWVSTRATLADAWGVPVSLGAVVNSTQQDQQAALSDNADELYFASTRPAGGADDIWLSTRERSRNP